MEEPIRPLTAREMKVYLWLVHDLMDTAQILEAQLRAIEIIARNPLPIDNEKKP